MERRDAGELDETVMRRMMRELDLEDESLSSSWVERVAPPLRGRSAHRDQRPEMSSVEVRRTAQGHDTASTGEPR